MTKKELARMQALRELGALRRTALVPQDVLPPGRDSKRDAMTRGWWFNEYAAQVGEGCSSSNSHSTYDTQKTTAQGPRAFHSTRLLALKALRHAMEIEFAKKLAKIDLMIEEEDTP